MITQCGSRPRIGRGEGLSPPHYFDQTKRNQDNISQYQLNAGNPYFDYRPIIESKSTIPLVNEKLPRTGRAIVPSPPHLSQRSTSWLKECFNQKTLSSQPTCHRPCPVFPLLLPLQALFARQIHVPGRPSVGSFGDPLWSGPKWAKTQSGSETSSSSS